MNVHALVHARIISALETLQREGALPAGTSTTPAPR